MVGWIIFRAENIHDAFVYIGRSIYAFRDGSTSVLNGSNIIIASTVIMIVIMQIFDWSQRNKAFGLQIVEGKPLLLRWGTYLMFSFFIIIFAGRQEEFIYFQF